MEYFYRIKDCVLQLPTSLLWGACSKCLENVSGGCLGHKMARAPYSERVEKNYLGETITHFVIRGRTVYVRLIKDALVDLMKTSSRVRKRITVFEDWL